MKLRWDYSWNWKVMTGMVVATDGWDWKIVAIAHLGKAHSNKKKIENAVVGRLLSTARWRREGYDVCNVYLTVASGCCWLTPSKWVIQTFGERRLLSPTHLECSLWQIMSKNCCYCPVHWPLSRKKSFPKEKQSRSIKWSIGFGWAKCWIVLL